MVKFTMPIGIGTIYIYIYIYEISSSYTWCNFLKLHWCNSLKCNSKELHIPKTSDSLSLSTIVPTLHVASRKKKEKEKEKEKEKH